MERRRLRVLLIEDSSDDATLLVLNLKRAGYDPVFEIVDNLPALEKALAIPTWDVVICDYVVPHLSIWNALKIFREKKLDIPFIVVSGALGAYVAAQAIKAGASDFIAKDDVQKVMLAVEGAWVQAERRREVESRVPVENCPWWKRLFGRGLRARRTTAGGGQSGPIKGVAPTGNSAAFELVNEKESRHGGH